MGKLDGKVAVVTGGCRGIGMYISLDCARAGAKVCVNYTSAGSGEKADAVVAEIEKAGGHAFAYRADVTDPAQVRAMYEETVSRYGQLDILVNNAGILLQGLLIEQAYGDIQEMLRVDLFGCFVAIKEAFPYLVKAKSGRVINIASQLGQKGGPELSAYSAAKGGVIALTKALALEFGALGMKTNILVNAVAPGPVDCGVTEHVSKEWRAAKELTLPLGRYCDGSEVSPAVVFLASDDGSAFIGQTISPNCGDTML